MRFCRTAILTASLAVVSAGFIPAARAQSPQDSVAIVSVTQLDKLLKNTSYLLQASNFPEMGGLVTIMTDQYTQGIDRTKPIGVFVTLNGPMPSAVICLPLSDRDAFFERALAAIGIEPDALGDGLFEVDTGGQVLFAKDANGWLYVAQNEQDLKSVPADPAASLGRLPSTYDIAVRINVESLPAGVKDMVTNNMRMGFENGIAQGDLTGEQLEQAKATGEAQLAQIEQLLNETERIILGWTVDEQSQTTSIQSAVQFLAGSKLAEQISAAANVTSDYTAFQLPYSAVNFRATTEIPEGEREMAVQNFRNQMGQVDGMLDKQDMPPEAAALLKEVISGLASITEKTIMDGKFDGAFSMSTHDETLKILMGGTIADGAALAQELKEMAAGLPDSTQAPKFEFDYGNYKGVTLHRVTAPIKIADPGAKRVFGDSLNITIGTAAKGFILALDPSGDEGVKAAIDRMESAMGQKVPPFDGVIEVGQILEFAQAVSPNSILDNAVQTIKQYAEKDTVKINGRLIERGAVYTMAIDEGILRAVGVAAKNSGGGGF